MSRKEKYQPETFNTVEKKVKRTTKPSFSKIVLGSCLGERISPTTIEVLLQQDDKELIFKSLIKQISNILSSIQREEQVKILKDLIKINEAI